MRFAALVLALAVSGCASLFGSYDIAPNGLARSDDALRRLLASGRPDTALARVAPREKASPDDELLRLLYEGAIAHYAGDYDRSNAAFERAIELAEDRYTKSVSRAALSLITSDRVLAYEPNHTERLLIHYYGALNYLQQGKLEDAAVEARRLSHLLQRYEDDGTRADEGLRTFLRYFAGAVFDAAGERNDAEVAYRGALLLAGEPIFSADTLPRDTLGEVIVLVERGFVAHRAEQALIVALWPEEVEALSYGDADSRISVGTHIAARIIEHAVRADHPRRATRPRTLRVPPGPRPERPRREERCKETDGAGATGAGGKAPQPDLGRSRPTANPIGHRPPLNARGPSCPDAKKRKSDDSPYLLKLAWPVYLAEPAPPLDLSVVGPDSQPVPVRMIADVSDAVLDEFQGERMAILARTLARAAAKYAITRGIENEGEEESEGLGRLLGLLANLGGVITERADTRAWHLLPAEIGLARLRLPPGRHTLTLAIHQGPGSSRTRHIELGPVDVRPGRVAFVATRLWND